MDIAKLAQVTLQDSTGVDRTLGEYWSQGPTVVAFLRHFG
jgi:hypothetical protein